MSLQPTSIIRDFASYSQAQLAQMKQALDLKMPLETLQICADYYRVKEKKRHPLLSEIRLADALFSLPAQSARTAISELYTSDSFVAETYADMMNKRRELHPEARTPVTVGEALGMATAYLARVGKTAALLGAHPRFTTRFFDENAVSALGSDVILDIGEQSAADTQAGDYLLLVRRGSFPIYKFNSEIDVILSEPDVRKDIRQFHTVGSDGLLPLVLRLASGAFFALNHLHPSAVVAPNMEVLVGCFEGDRLLVVSPSNRDEAVRKLSDLGLNAAVIGAISNDNRVRFGFSANPEETVSIESAFLRNLTVPAPAVAKLPSEGSHTADAFRHVAISPLQCPYLPMNESSAPERMHANGKTVAAAHCDTAVSFFRSALHTVLSAVLSATASGAELESLRLAIDLTLPLPNGEENRLGEAISAILGIYRAQIELALPAATLSIRSNDGAEHPSLTVFAINFGATLPSHVTANGNALYCVSPVLAKDGLPNFAAMRSLLGDLSNLAKNGSLSSLRLLCGEDLTDGLKQMETPTLTSRITDPAAVTTSAFPLAMLIESAEALPFAKIATVVAKPEGAASHTVRLPDLKRSLTFDGVTEVLIYAEKDSASESLAERLRREGARTHLLTPDTSDVALARELLTAQLVLLCNRSLPESPAVAFAARTLCEAGGAILLLGDEGKLPALGSAFRMKDGISQDILIDIFQK